jgi:hypothetical protein
VLGTMLRDFELGCSGSRRNWDGLQWGCELIERRNSRILTLNFSKIEYDFFYGTTGFIFNWQKKSREESFDSSLLSLFV